MAKILDDLKSRLRKTLDDLSGSMSDNAGWVRQGQFTPAKQVSEYFNPNSNNGNNFWSSPVARGLAKTQQAIPKPAQQFSQGFGNTTTYGLVDFKPQGQPTAAYRVGQVAGMLNPLNPVNKGMAALNIGGKVLGLGGRAAIKLAPQAVARIAPKVAPIVPKVAGGVISELAQTGVYTAAQKAAQAAGLQEKRPINFASNLASGVGMRGVAKQIPNVALMVKKKLDVDSLNSIREAMNQSLDYHAHPPILQRRIIENLGEAVNKVNPQAYREISKIRNTDKQLQLFRQVLGEALQDQIPGTMRFAAPDRSAPLKIVSSSGSGASTKATSGTTLKLRGFAKSVVDTKDIPKEVADFARTQTYEPLTNQEVLKTVSKIVKRGDSFAVQFAKSDTSVNGNATAMVMLRRLIDQKRFDEANDLIASVAPRFTKQGQQIQILAQWSRLKPEGAVRYAQQLLDKANKANPRLNLKLTPENTALITERARAIARLQEGSRERIVATAQLMQTIADQVPASLGQKIGTLQTMSQLLNFKTPVRNVLGNAIFSAAENVSDVVGTGIDKATSLVTGQRTKVLPSLSAQTQGLKSGLKQGMEDVRLGIDTSGGVGSMYDLPNRTFTKGVLDRLEKTLNYTLRVPDRAAYTAAFEGSLNNQMRAAGVNKATETMLEVAHNDALYRTFQDNSKLAQIFGGLKKTLNKAGTPDGKFGLGDLILKYPKTPANILSRGLDYSPAGVVKALYEASRPIVAGEAFNQKQFVESLSRGLTGTGMIAVAYMLAKSGIVSGQQEKDYDIAATQRAAGNDKFRINLSALRRFLGTGGQPQTAKTGDITASYDWAQPSSLSFSIGADMALNGAKESKISSFINQSIGTLDTAAETFTNQSMVKGISNFITDLKDKGIGSALTNTALNAPSGFTPSLLNQFANLFDTTARDTYSPDQLAQAKNKVITRLPGLRNQLQPRVDVFGQEQRNYETDGLARVVDVFFNPAFVSRIKANPEAEEVLRIYARSGETQQAPRVAQKSVKINGAQVQLTPDQYTQYQKYIGTKTKEVFGELIADPMFQNASDEQKAQLMANVLTDINSAAKIELLGNQPKRVESGVKQMMNDKAGMVTFTKDGNLKLSSGDLTPPTMTGNAALDKKLVTSYNGQITTAINDVVELYRNGGISPADAEKRIDELEALRQSKGKGIKVKALKSASLKLTPTKAPPKLQLPKLTLRKPKLTRLSSSRKRARVKLKALSKPKLSIRKSYA